MIYIGISKIEFVWSFNNFFKNSNIFKMADENVFIWKKFLMKFHSKKSINLHKIAIIWMHSMAKVFCKIFSLYIHTNFHEIIKNNKKITKKIYPSKKPKMNSIWTLLLQNFTQQITGRDWRRKKKKQKSIHLKKLKKRLVNDLCIFYPI